LNAIQHQKVPARKTSDEEIGLKGKVNLKFSFLPADASAITRISQKRFSAHACSENG
jgi:hypothetical protein